MNEPDLVEIRVKLKALYTLFWRGNFEEELPDEFGWGIGLLLRDISKEVEALEEKA